MFQANLYDLYNYENKLYDSRNKFKNFNIVLNFIFAYFVKIVNNNQFSTYLSSYIEVKLKIDKDHYYNISNYINNLINDNALINIKISKVDTQYINIEFKIDSHEFIYNNNMNQIISELQIDYVYQLYSNKVDLYGKLIDCNYKKIIYNKKELLKNIYIYNTNIISNDYVEKNRNQFTKYAKILNKDINIIEVI